MQITSEPEKAPEDIEHDLRKIDISELIVRNMSGLL